MMFIIPENDWGFIDDEKKKELSLIYDAIQDMGGGFFPKHDEVLRFLNMEFGSLKYVIVGMEPYPTSVKIDGVEMPEATGRSFEVRSLRGKGWDAKFRQSSLRNILKAVHLAETGVDATLSDVREEIADGRFSMLPPGKWFDSMESQGVLFLNASLTVRPYDVGSHKKLWDRFMSDLISHIEKEADITWLLWGNDAQQRVGEVRSAVRSCHPRLAGFVSECCFMDERLKKVDWKGIGAAQNKD